MGGQSLAIGTRKKAFSRIIFSNAALLVLLGLVIFNSIFTKNFANANTVSLLIRQSASIFCVAMGMSFVIATGNIDISVGPMMALAAILCVKIEEATGSYLFGILGALGVWCRQRRCQRPDGLRIQHTVHDRHADHTNGVPRGCTADFRVGSSPSAATRYASSACT